MGVGAAVKLLPPAEIGPVERAAWRELAGHAAEPNPFFEPEFVLAAWSRMRPRGVGLLVAHDGDGWSACLPARLPRAGGRLVLGWTHRYGFLSTPLVRRDVVYEGVAQLLSRAGRVGPWALVLRQSGVGGAVDAALAATMAELGLARAWERHTVRAVARPLDGSPRRRRRSLDRDWRRLQKHLGAELTVEDRGASAAALEEFLMLEAAGWKGAAGTALACNAGDRAFFVAMATGFAALGRLRLSVLSAGDRTVAMSCDLIAGDALFGFKSCHDESLRRYAPGIQLFDRILERFHADPMLTLYDSCSDPGAAIMNELFGAKREIASLVAVPHAAAGVARAATSAGLALRNRIERVED